MKNGQARIALRRAEFLEALLEGHASQCRSIVDELIADGALRLDLYQHLYKHALYEVGHRWERHLISVATEHAATAIVSSLMTLNGEELFESARIGKTILILCSGSHRIGPRMVADAFSIQGWDTRLVDLDEDLKNLMALIAQVEPHAIGLSLALDRDLPRGSRILAVLAERWPRIPVLVGGQSLTREAFSGGIAHPGLVITRPEDDLKTLIGMP